MPGAQHPSAGRVDWEQATGSPVTHPHRHAVAISGPQRFCPQCGAVTVPHCYVVACDIEQCPRGHGGGYWYQGSWRLWNPCFVVTNPE